MPIKDRFWRVGVRVVTTDCYSGEELFAEPAKSRPKRPTQQDPDEEQCDPNAPDYGSNAVTILFAGNGYVATEEFEPGRHRYYPLRVRWIERDSPSDDYEETILALVGRETEEALNDLARKAVGEALAEEFGTSDPDEPKPASPDRKEVSLGFSFRSPDLAVRRGTGRWILVGRIQPEVDGLGRDWTADFILPQTPPRALVGHDVLFPPWEVIARKVPGARDAFSSPTKDLLVVLTSDALLAFEITHGTIGKQAVRFPLVPGETAVMAQWATGKYVARWTRELKGILKP